MAEHHGSMGGTRRRSLDKGLDAATQRHNFLGRAERKGGITGATKMPIRRYVEHGVYSSDALSAMSKAFAAAIRTLAVGRDEMKRETVAKFIIGLAREDPALDAATLHRKTVAAFGNATNGGEPQYVRV